MNCSLSFFLKETTTLPSHLNYAIRFPGESRTIENNQFSGFSGNWQTDFIFNDFSAQGPRNKDKDDGGFCFKFEMIKNV